MENVDAAQTDLQTAIELSGGRGTAAAQAHTQRGLILMLRGDEEQALEDFKVNSSVFVVMLSAMVSWSNRLELVLVTGLPRVKQ